jgi:hypothetical protein
MLELRVKTALWIVGLTFDSWVEMLVVECFQ